MRSRTRIHIDDTGVAEEVRRFFRLGFVDAVHGNRVDDDHDAWEPAEREAYDQGRAVAERQLAGASNAA